MARRMENKAVLLVGAGASGPGWGNGKAAAVLYAREGARVFCVDRNLAAAQETVGLIEREGGQAVAHGADVAESGEVAGLVEACASAFGRIDVLHNNVGILEVGGPVEASEESWDRVMAVNVKSMFLTCKAVVPVMLGQGGGAIVNIASIAAIRWLGVAYASYTASKGAVVSFTRALALEYAGRGIRANSILPGLMHTPMIVAPLTAAYGSSAEEMFEKRHAQCPMGHMGDAWDVAYAALYLASDEAKYVTGTELAVDGGLTASI